MPDPFRCRRSSLLTAEAQRQHLPDDLQHAGIVPEVSIDAWYQAIPYEPLMVRAMVDSEAAEALVFFPELATSRYRDDPMWRELAPVARRIVRDRPGILDRSFSTRGWDAVYWLLARNRREEKERDPGGLAEIAVFGAEAFPCGATATQGIPLRFVRPGTAAAVAAYVESTAGNARDVFDADAMVAAGVYKSPWGLDHLLEVTERYARLYRLAAELDECVLVVRD